METTTVPRFGLLILKENIVREEQQIYLVMWKNAKYKN